jgi:hypothetical protein
MGQSSSSSDDLADLLYAPDDVASASHGDDLLSQLAGESIDRMISGEFEPIVNPVEKLTNQLDTFFEELQHRRLMKSIPPASLASPEAIAITRQADDAEQFEISDERAALNASASPDSGETASPARAMLLVAGDEIESEPAYLRLLDWMGAPIEALSTVGRVAASLAAVASFIAACGTLAWVITLRSAG